MRKFLFAAAVVALATGGIIATASADVKVRIVNPVNSETVAGQVTVRAEASSDAGIARVEFSFENGSSNAPIAIATEKPYTFTFDASTLPEGPHSVGAKAFDTAGNQNFTYNLFYVGASTTIAHGCQDTVLRIVNRTNDSLFGGIWGTQGAMGSGGFSAPAQQVSFFNLPTNPRVGPYTGDYGVHATAQRTDGTMTTCEGTIPVAENNCPRIGTDTTLVIRESRPSRWTTETQLRCEFITK